MGQPMWSPSVGPRRMWTFLTTESSHDSLFRLKQVRRGKVGPAPTQVGPSAII